MYFKLYFPPVFFVLSFLWSFPCEGQKYFYNINRFTPEEGLPHLLTSAVFKDSRGYLWINTSNGLSRYDGYSFEPYNKQSTGLSSIGEITRIEEDQKGNLWLFYTLGDFHLSNMIEVKAIDVLNPITKKAIPINEYLKAPLPFKLIDIYKTKIKDQKGRIWITTRQGQIFLYQDGQFEKIFEQKTGEISNLAICDSSYTWITSEQKLIQINFSGQIIESHTFENNINDVWVEKEGKLWITELIERENNRALKFWVKAREEDHFNKFIFSNQLGFFKLKNKTYFFVHRSNKGYWYINLDINNGQDNKFHLFDKNGNKLTEFQELLGIDFDPGVVDYEEDGNVMWFATPTGLLKTEVFKSPFHIVHQVEGLSNCRGIAEDDEGNIYFLNKNIYKWNPEKQQVTPISTFPGNYALIYEDSLLWASYRPDGGLFVNLNTKQELQLGEAISLNHTFTSLKIGNDGLYLLGRFGLYYLDLYKQKISPFNKYNEFQALKTTNIYFIHRNKNGIWLATEDGVYLMNEQVGVLKHFNASSGALPFDKIRHIYEDKEGIFWLSTQGGGIIKWQPDLENKGATTFKQLTTSDGLSNNFTYAIYEDDFSRLWIPSDRGLMCMDKQSFEIKTFLVEDGLPHNEFNLTAHFQASDGSLYFGGLGGLICIHPDQFQEKWIHKAPLTLIRLGIWEDGKESIADKTESWERGDDLLIYPSDRYFEAEIALLDFEKPEDHQYYYLIEGFDERWQPISGNILRFTNLPYGKYNLKIKGQHIRKGMAAQELKIPVHVLKPFYLRGWFILTLTIAVFMIIVIIVQRREYQLKRDREKLEEEIIKRTKKIEEAKNMIEAQAEALKELDKVKTRFFSNITHEFRTPLTLIIGPLEQAILEQPLPNIFRRRIQGVLKNARQLLGLINQLLDLAKLEGGQMQIEINKGDLVNYTQRIIELFGPLAHKKGQQLIFISSQDSWDTHFDRKKWDKIIFNLLSNAIKFTPQNGSIQVNLIRDELPDEEAIRLVVKDTGIGIEKNHLEQIFNRFYQIDSTSTRSHGGTGIGLSLVKELVDLQGGNISVSSEIQKGTTFEVFLPVLQATQVKPLVEEMMEESTPFPLVAIEPASSAIPDEEFNSKEKLELLLIEDNEEMREYIRYCLGTKKYNFTEAANGEEGIEKALALVPDLIISDVMMPLKDGFEVTQAIRNNVGTSHIPLILLTAKASLESRLQGLRRGVDAYLTKPFSPQELALRIEKLIEIRRLLQQRYQNAILPSDNDTFQQEDEFVINLRNFIHQRIDDSQLNGDYIGKHFGLSRVHLYRKLKALTGKSISEFVKTTRLEKALELVQEGKLNISEIAWQTGFASVSYFSTSFKKAYGKNPSEM